MDNDKINTEKKILASAKKVFTKKGYDGTRMQEIADEAQINKALLHYYFRSKDKLFERIFDDALADFGPRLIGVFQSDKPLEVTIWEFVDNYISFMQLNPHIPMFILREVQNNPEKIVNKLPNFDIAKTKLNKILNEEIEKGNIIDISIMEFFLNIISLCVFPIAAKNIMKGVFDVNEAEYKEFYERRKKTIPLLIMNGIKKK